ncbi:MAG: carboxyl transferase domain-containing protein [Halioglobus sp.]
MSKNRDAWQPLLHQLEQRNTRSIEMGGAEKIAKQHGRGRLTARERIDALCDDNSFNEYGALAGGCHPGGEPPLAGDGVVGGTGEIGGRTVVIIAEDFTVKGGSIGHPNAAKRTRLVRLAQEQLFPLILMLDGAGERATNQTERYPNTPGDLQLVADLKGVVPVVTLVLGTSAGHGALTGMFADLIIMREGSAMFTAGPPLVKASLGLDATPEELGGALMHTTVSGVAHNLGRTEEECFAMARSFLSVLPQHSGLPIPETRGAGSERRRVDDLLDIIPPQSNQAYDMRQVLNAICDSDSLFELQPGFGKNIITAIATLGGTPCMLVANQPTIQAGAITVDAAEKATHFIEVATNFKLPLITLLDNPGVMPGPAAEKSGVLKAAGRMFLAQRRYQGKKIVVTLRKAFGFGSSVMGMNPWDGQAISLALPCVNLGSVPAIGGAEAAKANAAESVQLQDSQSGAWVPADAMAFDKVVNPVDLRNEIIGVLQSK